MLHRALTWRQQPAGWSWCVDNESKCLHPLDLRHALLFLALCCQVVRDGDGVLGLVDYATADDMATAIKKLDDTEFRNPYDK